MSAQFPFQLVSLVNGRIREMDCGTFEDRDGKEVDWTKIVIDYFGGFVVVKPSLEDFHRLKQQIRVGQTIEAAGTVKMTKEKGLEMKQIIFIKDENGQKLLNETPAEASANVPTTETAAPAPPRASVFGSRPSKAAA